MSQRVNRLRSWMIQSNLLSNNNIDEVSYGFTRALSELLQLQLVYHKNTNATIFL